MAELKLEEAKCPDGGLIGAFEGVAMQYEFYGKSLIEDEKIVFKRLVTNGFEVVETVALDGYEYHDARANMILKVDCNTTEDAVKKDLENQDNGCKIEIIKYEVLSSDDKYHNVNALIRFYRLSPRNFEITESPFYDEYWNRWMEEVIDEGVCYSKSKVPDDLRDSLRNNIDKLANETEIDFHPNSNDVVRDLVHPALYCYIDGVSALLSSDLNPPKAKKGRRWELDFWGRSYEDSKFQWLPSPFYVSADGKCSIKAYINNLEKDKFANVYSDLEKLFELFIPYFEEVWSYAKAVDFSEEIDYDYEKHRSETFKFDKPDVKFRDQELQVITKIVDYTLQPGQSYEGVWHAEGMSHENIVMTGIYFIDRDSELKGGDLRFKRTSHNDETVYLSDSYINGQDTRPISIDQFAMEGFMPLGRFPTEEGYMLVFPNCHIHKIAKFVNESKTKAASRRIVVFFFVNPEREIISTREVAPQQEKISLSDAKKYRLELMAERKYDKEKLNIRGVSLCEH